jgi:hypothetical protein
MGALRADVADFDRRLPADLPLDREVPALLRRSLGVKLVAGDVVHAARENGGAGDMKVVERDPKFLLERGYIERLEDFEYERRRVLASRLGYRITEQFAERFLGRLFETPDAVFPEPMLRPEKQDRAQFAQGLDAIVEAQQRVALLSFEDGSVEHACQPVKALLHIMAHGRGRS